MKEVPYIFKEEGKKKTQKQINNNSKTKQKQDLFPGLNLKKQYLD